MMITNEMRCLSILSYYSDKLQTILFYKNFNRQKIFFLSFLLVCYEFVIFVTVRVRQLVKNAFECFEYDFSQLSIILTFNIFDNL